MGLTNSIGDILSAAASSALPQQGTSPTTFGPAPLAVPPSPPRFQPPQLQVPKAGNEFSTVSGNKRATKQALFSGIAQTIKAGGDYIQAKKNRALESDITRLIGAQEGEKEAQEVLKQNPNDPEAKKSLATNRAIQNDITSDPKKAKQLEKAFNIDLFGKGKNKNENAALASAMTKWQQDKAAADKTGGVQPLNPIAQRFQQSQPVRQQVNPALTMQAEMIKAGLKPDANSVLKAQSEGAIATLKAQTEDTKNYLEAKTAEDKIAAADKLAHLKADADKYKADKLFDAQLQHGLDAKAVADINQRARKYVADSTAAEWDKRIEIMKGKEGSNTIFKSLSKDADDLNKEYKDLNSKNTNLQKELDKKGSSLWGIKFGAASGPDAANIRNQMQINDFRMKYLKGRLDDVGKKLQTLAQMGLIAPDTSQNTPNDAPEPDVIRVSPEDMNASTIGYMPETTVPDQTQTVDVHGPDGKLYKFPKGTTKDKAISYFKKKGIGVKQAAPKSTFTPTGPDPAKVKESMTGGVKSSILSGVDYASKELPAIGGAGFGLAAGGKTNIVGSSLTALGGMAGQAGNEIIQRLVFNRSGSGIPTGSPGDTNYNTIKDIIVQGAKQGALEYTGRKMGDVFFGLLNRIPHAVIKYGIRLLPSDINGGKITKYVEDLLSNLMPSSEVMAKYKAGQNQDVIDAAEKLAKGFSRFRGTTEKMGQLLQDTYRSLEYGAKKDLKALAKTLTNPKNIYKTAEYAAYIKNFKNELAVKIVATNKPELIGGYLRSSSSLQEIRNMVSMLEGEAPKVMNAVRTRLLQDTLQEALTGQTDPVMKDLQKQGVTFIGSKFKQALDKIGEDKLKAIFGKIRYNNLMEFSKLVQHIGGTSGAGAGKFLNLIFLISPLRYGISLTTGRHILVEGIAFNRAAKIMTSTEGIRLYENFIRAFAIGGVKTISAARDALKTYTEHQDAEYIQEQQQIEDQYYKDHPDEKKYLDEQKKKQQQQ